MKSWRKTPDPVAADYSDRFFLALSLVSYRWDVNGGLVSDDDLLAAAALFTVSTPDGRGGYSDPADYLGLRDALFDAWVNGDR